MVVVAQLVERWLVVPDVAGSSPVIHPMFVASSPVLSSTDLERDTTTESRIAPDLPWQTVVWNDPVNLMTYVTHVFRSYFGYSKPEAERLMLQVHNDGRAVVSSGSREEMERDVTAMHEFGLWATLDKSDE